MKWLNTITNKIVFVEFNNYFKFDCNNAADVLSIKPFIYRPSNYSQQPFLRNHVAGIYLGKEADFLKDMQNAKFSGTPKSLYFTTNSKYPRHKVTAAGIKRKLNPEAADAIVASQAKYSASSSGTQGYTHIEVHFSTSKKEYYFVQYYVGLPAYSYRDKVKEKTWFDSHFGTSLTRDYMASAIKEAQKLGGLPADMTLIYTGPCVYFGKDDSPYVELVLDSNMKLIYDTELDTLIVKDQMEVDEESLKQIDKMLQSSDESVVGMAMKLLTNMNYNNACIPIGTMLVNRWDNIRYLSVFKSTAFQQMLTSLDLPTTPSAYINPVVMYNKFYEASTREEDRAELRKQIVSIAKETADKYLSSLQSTYEKFGLIITCDIT